MSRPSTSSTRGPSRKPSACADSYDGDMESLARMSSEVENYSVYSNCNELLFSPAFQMISTRRISSDTTLTSESSPVGSEFETETSNSNTSAGNYTDSDFCRVQRTAVQELVESAEVTQRDEMYKIETARRCETRTDSANGSATLLYLAKPITDEASKTSPELFGLRNSPIYFSSSQQGHEDNDFVRKTQALKLENEPQTRNSVDIEPARSAQRYESSYSSSGLVDRSVREIGSDKETTPIEKSIRESELAEQEIIQKQRALKNSFNDILREARKTLREAQAKQSAPEVTKARRNKAANKPQNERFEGLKLEVTADSKQKKSFHVSGKSKDVWVGKRPQVSPRSINQIIKQHKKQEAIQHEKRKVQDLLAELHGLDLHQQAANVENALALKENQDKEYDIQLKAERRDIKRKKNIEACREKEERKRKRTEEIRKMEAERKEKEEIERKKRIEEAKKRREKNRMLWESYNAALLASSVTRPFTYSYFPKLRLQPLEITPAEPQKRTHSQKHGGKCHE